MSKNSNKTTSKISNASRVVSRSTTKASTPTTTAAAKSNTLSRTKNDPNKDEEKKILSNKSSIYSSSTKGLNTKNISSPSTSSSIKLKPKLAIASKIKPNINTSRNEPLRVKRDPATLDKIKNLKSVNISNKPNLIKDTYHNVTIASPPPLRKKQNSTEFQSLPPETNLRDNLEPKLQERRKTITLEPEEVFVLKNDKYKSSENVDAYFGSTVKKKSSILMGKEITIDKSNKNVKGPVAFEINFEDRDKLQNTATSTIEKHVDDKINLTKNKNDSNAETQECICSDEYEDDFESYESDFETDSSSAEAVEDSDESSDNLKFHKNNTNFNNIDYENDNLQNKQIEQNDDADLDDEDSEETQPPITVIHRQEKETERKLDSGSYDLKSVTGSKTTLQPQQPDSLDTTTNNSDRLDSGLGNTSNIISSMTYWSNGNPETIFPISSDSKRGVELMKKIKLDEITYHLFELKPMNYEYYMKIYGNLNTIQSSTQTNENIINAECQTDDYELRSIWTQHPPHFDINSVQNNSLNYRKSNFIYCGEEEFINNCDADEIVDNSIQTTIKSIQKFSKTELKGNNLLFQRNEIDFERLNEFLNRVKITVYEVLNRNANNYDNTEITKSSFSDGYQKLNANFLNALKVIKIISKVKFNFILTIHESTEDIYRNDFQNLIVVWSTSDLLKPIRLLSSWSQICKVDICAESTDIIVSGLKDGSIAMWDLRETYSYCSKLDGYLSHFAASQSIVPSFGRDNDRKMQTNLNYDDLGAVIDIKSFKSETGAYALKAYKQIQFVSLNETGILTIWSLIEIGRQDFKPRTPSKYSLNVNNIKIEFSSPWARVKLVQSAICDLRSYLEIKNTKIQTKFEQTILYFENSIFDDETLKELQKPNKNYNNISNELQGIRFTTLDTSSNMIYVATNRNFILACSKTLKPERFRKIHINDSVFMFPTAIRLHPNEEFLLIGLSNGSVIAINCNQNKPKSFNINNEFDNDDDNDNLNSLKSNSGSIDINEMKKIQSSCVMQNMIRNERKIFEEIEKRNSSYMTDKEYRPRTAILEFDEINDNIDNPWNKYKMFDQQVILNGSILRKNLIECIEISMDGRKLYCLSDGNIKIYDFLTGNEIKCLKDEEIKGISLCKAETDIGHYMVLLKSNNIVEIHKPKN